MMDTRDSGLYVITLEAPRDRRIRIGKMGVISFGAGSYFYIGSAQKNLHKRVARHKQREKLKKWHIDYLRSHCRFVGATLYAGRSDECALAVEVMAKTGGVRTVKRFGSSDCGCGGHLIFVKNSG